MYLLQAKLQGAAKRLGYSNFGVNFKAIFEINLHFDNLILLNYVTLCSAAIGKIY